MEAEDRNKVYSQGSNARIQGKPISECPYVTGEYRFLWKQGWKDVDLHWGEGSMGRWEVMPLPEVGE